MKKIYLIKSPAPWMFDEMEEFVKHSKFEIIFLRKPDNFYASRIEAINSLVAVNIAQYRLQNITLRKIVVAFRFFFTHFSFFLKNKYSFVVGVKALYWFLFLNNKLIDEPLNIHAQFATQPTLLAALIKSYSLHPVEYSFTFHAHDIYFNNSWFNVFVENSIKAISISEFNIKYVLEKYSIKNQDKICLHRLGALPRNNTPYQYSNPLRIGLMSWFQEKKGISYLLKAIKSLKDKGLHVSLLLAGDGPLKDKLLSEIEAFEITDFVTYLGPLVGDEKATFFKSIDLFVLPAITIPNDMDGIPVVLMEALSYKLPIVSTNVSGIPEICVDGVNGVLVNEKSATALETCLHAIIDDKNLLTILSQKSSEIFDKFNIEINAKKKLADINWI